MSKKRYCIVVFLVLLLLIMVSSVAADKGRLLHMFGWTPTGSNPPSGGSNENVGEGEGIDDTGGVGEGFGGTDDVSGDTGVGEGFEDLGDISSDGGTGTNEEPSIEWGNTQEDIPCLEGECTVPPQLTSDQGSQACSAGLAINNFEGGCCYNGAALNDYSVYLAATSDYGKVACIGGVVYACSKPDVPSWLEDVASTDGITFAESYSDPFKNPITKDSLVCTDGVWTKMKDKTCLSAGFGFLDVFLKCKNNNFIYDSCEPSSGSWGDTCESKLDEKQDYQTVCYAGTQSLDNWMFCSSGCKDGACVSQSQLSCSSDCSASGAKQCSGSGYQVCGYYDSDSCLEWSAVTSCSSGYTCSNGQCTSQSTANTCNDTDGGKDYYVNGKLSYGSFVDYDNCLELTSQGYIMNDNCVSANCYINEGFCDSTKSYSGMPLWFDQSFKCPNGCKDGACVSQSQPSCTSDCSASGAKQCSGSGYQVCGNYDSDSCLEWSAVTSCSSGEICSNGQCVTQTQSCSDTCSTNSSKQCSGSGYQVCGNYDSDSCLEWSSITPCSQNSICSDGVCTPSCTPECSTSGAKQCSGSGYQVCGNYDSDSCLEWSAVTSCSSGYTCSSGQCVVQSQSCTDQCHLDWQSCTTNATASWYAPCGNFDSDSCLEWGPVQYCPTGLNCNCQNNNCACV